jgi:hypothetical protein
MTFKLIMKIGPLRDACRTHWIRGFMTSGRALDPGIHRARTRWMRDFMTFRLVRRAPGREADGVGVT